MRDDPHYVYVIVHQTGEKKFGAPCKVGISANPDGRVPILQTGNPQRIMLAFVFEVPNKEIATEIERAFHTIYAEHRLAGEWFDLHPLDTVVNVCAAIMGMLEAIGVGGEMMDAALAQTGVTEALAFVYSFRRPEGTTH